MKREQLIESLAATLDVREAAVKKDNLEQDLRTAYIALGTKAEKLALCADLPMYRITIDRRQKAAELDAVLNQKKTFLRDAEDRLEAERKKHNERIKSLEEEYRQCAEAFENAKRDVARINERIKSDETRAAKIQSELSVALEHEQHAEKAAGEKRAQVGAAKSAWGQAESELTLAVESARDSHADASSKAGAACQALDDALRDFGEAIVKHGHYPEEQLGTEISKVRELSDGIEGLNAYIARRRGDIEQTKGGTKRFLISAGLLLVGVLVVYLFLRLMRRDLALMLHSPLVPLLVIVGGVAFLVLKKLTPDKKSANMAHGMHATEIARTVRARDSYARQKSEEAVPQPSGVDERPRMIEFTCPHCRRSQKVDVAFAGLSGYCEHCTAPIHVPYPQGTVRQKETVREKEFPSLLEYLDNSKGTEELYEILRTRSAAELLTLA